MSQDFTVHLEQVFQGPMDLLLHLVREQEVEIHEIEIARILEGYLAYLSDLEELDIEYAGEFLVMAATLMSIKSRSLLPHEEVDLAEELDPRDELIQKLIEYRRFRSAADTLHSSYQERSSQSPRGSRERLSDGQRREFDLGEVSIWDLFATFSRLMRETLADRPHQVAGDPRPLRFYVDQVVVLLRTGEHSTLRGLIRALADVPAREALVGSFCALLELVRLELVEARQMEGVDDIALVVRAEHAHDIEDVVSASRLGEPEEELETSIEAPAEDEPEADAREAHAPDAPAPDNAADAGNGHAPRD